jgi:hypothetical protein
MNMPCPFQISELFITLLHILHWILEFIHGTGYTMDQPSTVHISEHLSDFHLNTLTIRLITITTSIHTPTIHIPFSTLTNSFPIPNSFLASFTNAMQLQPSPHCFIDSPPCIINSSPTGASLVPFSQSS